MLFIITGTLIGTDIISLPSKASENSAQNGWISIIVGAVLPFIMVILIERACRLYPDMTLIDIVKTSLGKVVGTIAAVFFILFASYITIVVVRVFSEIAKLYLLPETPIPVIALTEIIIVAYVTIKGVKTLARLNEILFYLLVFSILMILLPSIKLFDYTNILPVGNIGLLPIIKDGINTSFSYAGVDVMLVFYTLTGKKDEVMKAGIIAVAAVMTIYTLITAACILSLGSEAMQKIMFPPITMIKGVSLPVIERPETFFLTFWMVLTTKPAINYSYCACFSTARLLGVNIEKNAKYILIPYCIIILAGASIFKDIIQAFEFAGIAGILFFIVGLGYPLLILITKYLFKRKDRRID